MIPSLPVSISTTFSLICFAALWHLYSFGGFPVFLWYFLLIFTWVYLGAFLFIFVFKIFLPFLLFISWVQYLVLFFIFPSFISNFQFFKNWLTVGYHILQCLLSILNFLLWRQFFLLLGCLQGRGGLVLQLTVLLIYVKFISWFSSIDLHRFYFPFVILKYLGGSLLSVWQSPGTFSWFVWFTGLFILFGSRGKMVVSSPRLWFSFVL